MSEERKTLISHIEIHCIVLHLLEVFLSAMEATFAFSTIEQLSLAGKCIVWQIYEGITWQQCNIKVITIFEMHYKIYLKEHLTYPTFRVIYLKAIMTLNFQLFHQFFDRGSRFWSIIFPAHVNGRIFVKIYLL